MASRVAPRAVLIHSLLHPVLHCHTIFSPGQSKLDVHDVVSPDRPALEMLQSCVGVPVTLVGDAAHSVDAILAQGAGVAIEDALALSAHLSRAIIGDRLQQQQHSGLPDLRCVPDLITGPVACASCFLL